MTIPTDDVFFSKTEKGKPDVEFLKDHFYREGRIKEKHALYIIDKATQLLRGEPNVLAIPDRDRDPVIVCGNIHGQYYDLMKLFEVGGHPSFTRYLFLGDYVNPGYFSIECLLYLWALKICYPDTFFLLRGHHECRRIAEHFTFEIECKHTYSERVYEAFLESFDTLPLVAIIAKRYFCVHGGISPDLHTIDDIRKLNRFCEPPKSGLMCDILWSDPIENFDEGYTTENFVHNSVRGVSYFYTYKAVCDFLKRNGLVSIIRAHQMPEAGYCTYHKRNGNPSVITVFSVPNCDGHQNKAAVVLIGNGKEHIFQQFRWSPHPHRLPRFMDAFSWSLPFICEKAMDMLAVVLYIYLLELNEGLENSTLCVARVDRYKDTLIAMLQNKILAVRCISYMFSVFRVGSEHVSEFKGFLRSSRPGLTRHMLSLRAEDIKSVIKSFNGTRISDVNNEHLPLIEWRLTSAPLPLPSAKDGAGEKVASTTATAGATSTNPFRRTKGGEPAEAKKFNTEVQDREEEVHSRKEAWINQEIVYRPEEARLPSELFEASTRHAEASPKIPEAPLIILEPTHQQDEQSDTSHLQTQTEFRTNRATSEIQDVEKQLRVKERHLQIREAELQGVDAVQRVRERHLQSREAEVQDVEEVQRVKERHLQIRESEVQKMLRAVNERREAMDLQEDNLRRRLAAMKEWEENPSLRLREATLTQQMSIAWQPDGTALGSDLFSQSSISTIRNAPYICRNVDLSPETNAKLKRDSEYHGNEFPSLSSISTIRNTPSIPRNVDLSPETNAKMNRDSGYHVNELASLASIARSGPSEHTNIYFSSGKSQARLKEDSEYYGNE